MRRAGLAAVLATILVAGCQFTRQDYQSVTLGQTPDQVKKILGTPRTQVAGEWTYTADDPRDPLMVTIWFGPEGKVIGKAWQNPDKPMENDRAGQTP
jgi:outer membrane protein assembly factor BamE (lipoprotein component of BamABCDE complex)